MSVLELDPNSVVAGWIPVALIAVLALACVAIFFSMRRHMRRIEEAFVEEDTEPGSGSGSASGGPGVDLRASHRPENTSR